MRNNKKVKATKRNSQRLEALYKIKCLEKAFKAECEEIALECEEEGYPSHGSNYDLRCSSLWERYEEEYDYLCSLI